MKPADIRNAFEMGKDTKTMEKTMDKLVQQRRVYWYKASSARTGLLNLRTTTSVGIVTGAVGAIISNVATAASGAGVALGSTLLNGQYSLAEQDPIYSTAATSVGCAIAALNGAPTFSTPDGGTPNDNESTLISSAQNAANQLCRDWQVGQRNGPRQLIPHGPNDNEGETMTTARWPLTG